MENIIKPCPFCSSNDVEVIHEEDREGEAYYVVCHRCGARGPFKFPGNFCDHSKLPSISQCISPEELAQQIADDFADSLVLFGKAIKRVKPKTEWDIGKDKAKEAAIEAWSNYDKTI
jgi:hypothetical protein